MKTDFKIIELDARYNGFGKFKYQLSVDGVYNYEDKLAKGIAYRNWCWETFGSGIERDFATLHEMRDITFKWAWHSDYRSVKLYFRSDEEMNWFKLRWL